MKKVDKSRASNNVQSKRSSKNGRKDPKLQQVNGIKKVAGKESKAVEAKEDTNASVSDSTTQSEPSEVSESLDVHYVDDDVSSNAHQESATMEKAEKDENQDPFCGLEKNHHDEGNCGGSHPEEAKDPEEIKLSSLETAQSTTISNSETKDDSKQLAGSAERIDIVDEVKEADVWEDASNGGLSAGSETEANDAKETNGKIDKDETLSLKIEEMAMRIEKLEEELREVAALEISLYSIVPEHVSSAHKLHTPARRLSRFYIHACKHWTQSRRATIARNIVSGLVLVTKSCSHDVSKLTFWFSNTIALREIIYQAFGSSRNSSPLTKISESNSTRVDGKPATLKWKKGTVSKQENGFMQCFEDWQEAGTFTAALEKVESWVFTRIVESVWWQVFTPHMQSPEDDPSASKTMEKLLGPALGDQQQGSFSVNLWNSAFQDARRRLCPIRAEGHDCGCLPVLARMVMEQCIARLDVAMLNAILRESEHQTPTDPVSDPILDSKVLPIPAGDLSFGSGAQLKNAIGNWSRSFTDMFGTDSKEEEGQSNEDNERELKGGERKHFCLLSDLSDLLMLPKDMLTDQTVRNEVCPSLDLPLIKRISCNFTPDEFCPDPVPGTVLEALNAESVSERNSPGESSRNFPYTASKVLYYPPSSADVAIKVAEAGERSQLSRNASMIQRKGYTSDEELDELESPLASIINKTLSTSQTGIANGNAQQKDHIGYAVKNARYDLLRQVWSA